jgi:hypothetical protein
MGRAAQGQKSGGGGMWREAASSFELRWSSESTVWRRTHPGGGGGGDWGFYPFKFKPFESGKIWNGLDLNIHVLKIKKY